MPYATQQMLTDRVGEPMLILLTDRAAVPLGVIDVATLARAQADADAMVDGYLGGRYALPLTTVPALVADIAQAITLWKLHTSDPEAKIKADYDDALKRLKDIAQGVIRLTDLAGLEAPSSGASGVQITDRERPFTEANMKGFTRRPRPVSDPTGSILGASSPLLDTLNVNNRDIRISGLPAAYVLKQGDYLGFTYGSGRRALHRVVPTTVTASGAGLTPLFEVVPMIRPGAVVATAVTLIKPVIKATVDPGSVNRGVTGAWVTTGASFRFSQTLAV